MCRMRSGDITLGNEPKGPSKSIEGAARGNDGVGSGAFSVFGFELEPNKAARHAMTSRQY